MSNKANEVGNLAQLHCTVQSVHKQWGQSSRNIGTSVGIAVCHLKTVDSHKIKILERCSELSHTQDDLKKENNLKNKDDLEKENNLKNEDDLKNEGDLKNEDDLKKWPSPQR